MRDFKDFYLTVLSKQRKALWTRERGIKAGSVSSMSSYPHFTYIKSSACYHLVVSDSLRPHGLQPTSFLCPWDFPGKNTGVCCHSLLQGIFPTQGSNLCLLPLLPWQVGSLTSVTTWEAPSQVIQTATNFFICHS